MIKQIKKIKNLLINFEENEKKPESDVNAIEESNESAYKKEHTSENLICDCCKINVVVEEKVDVFSNRNGELISLYKEPKITYKGGMVEDDVIICNECLEFCGNDMNKKRYALLSGMINKINVEIESNKEKKLINEQEINNIMMNSNKQIETLEKANLELSEDTNELYQMIEQIDNEIKLLEQSF